MRNQPFIALDLGTSSLKGAVLDAERLRVTHMQRLPFPEPLPGLPPLFCEMDAGQVVAGARRLLDQLAPHAPDCAGLLMCGQMGGLVLTGETGEALSNYVSWRDQRLLGTAPGGQGSYFDWLCERLGPDARRQLGNEVRPGHFVGYLFWLAQEGRLPAAPLGTPLRTAGQAAGQVAYAASLPDFVMAQLCGARPGLEATLATGALNLETRDWHTTAFERLGLAAVRWPALLDLREPVGYVEVGGQRVPGYPPVGDHQCALAGASLAYGELSLNISTGSQAGLLTPRFEPGEYQTRPYFDGRCLNTFTHIPAGRALNVLLGLLNELPRAQGVSLGDPWAYIQQAAEAAGDTDLEVDLAFFPSPVGQRGAIANIREDNLTLGQLFFAAFRNMADNYRACALRLSPEQAWKTLVFSGGLAQKLPLLREMILARLPGEHRLCASTEDTLLGLLAAALVVSGRAPAMAAASDILRQQPPEVGAFTPALAGGARD